MESCARARPAARSDRKATVYVETTRHVEKSARVSTDDLDLARAAEVGLSDDEVFALTYFADVENQSLRYLRTLLGMKVAFEPEVAAFLATWNYEEFFHGYALERLMRACGVRIADDRRTQKMRESRWNERVERVLVPILNIVCSNELPAVYFAFGASHELTTLRGYEALARNTQNPALKVLCGRIAKQERRHFTWYFQRAQHVLEHSLRAQKLVRTTMRFNWVPVGAGVHTPAQVERLFRVLFYPRARASQVVASIDSKICSLPGLRGLEPLRSYFARAGAV
jgi:hypothetical protein